MFNRFDRHILARLFTITIFVLAVLIFIFIIIDFSENSDNFTDQGATLVQIWDQYYLNYIPEMIRLVLPVAVFIGCLILTGQLAERFEIIALKAAGVSLYRLIIPYLIFGLAIAGILSYLDAYIIPPANEERIDFEQKYLRSQESEYEKTRIYRQLSSRSILRVNYYDAKDSSAFNISIYNFNNDTLEKILQANRLNWNNKRKTWHLVDPKLFHFTKSGYTKTDYKEKDTTLNVFPRDLARSSSDIYQLTYPQAYHYIQSIERSGASGVNLPKVQFYGRLFYPLSIITVLLIGFSLAAGQRQGGKGVQVAIGLTISFVYLAFMKIIEPFGAAGEIHPVVAASLPHTFFLLIGLGMLLYARK